MVRRHGDILLADIDNMRAEVDMLCAGMTGRIRLGIVPSLAPALLAESIARTLESRPQVRFEIREGATVALLAALNRNDLDMTFGRILDAYQTKGLRVRDVYAESFAIVCAARHTLAGRRNVQWAALAQCRWVMPPAGSPMRQLVDDMFTHNRVLRPDAAVESSSLEQMRHLICHSELLGMVPRSMANLGKASHELAMLKPEVGDDFAPISLISRSHIEQTPLMELFTQRVCETASTMKLV